MMPLLTQKDAADIPAPHISVGQLLRAVNYGCHFCIELKWLLSDEQYHALEDQCEEWMATNRKIESFTSMIVEVPKTHHFAHPTDSLRVHILFNPEINDRLRDIARNDLGGSAEPVLFMELLPFGST